VRKPENSVSFLLSINIFVWQNVLYFPNDLRTCNISNNTMKLHFTHTVFSSLLKFEDIDCVVCEVRTEGLQRVYLEYLDNLQE